LQFILLQNEEKEGVLWDLEAGMEGNYISLEMGKLITDFRG
jgi:hypothetical protein